MALTWHDKALCMRTLLQPDFHIAQTTLVQAGPRCVQLLVIGQRPDKDPYGRLTAAIPD
jgi:hypothetical protein